MAKKKKKNVSIRSSAAEYLTYIAAVGGEGASSFEVRYEEENLNRFLRESGTDNYEAGSD